MRLLFRLFASKIFTIVFAIIYSIVFALVFTIFFTSVFASVASSSFAIAYFVYASLIRLCVVDYLRVLLAQEFPGLGSLSG